MPIQELLEEIQYELSAATQLPMAVDFLLTELKHSGMMSPAMVRLPHYFAAFQTYLISEAEREDGRFDMRMALRILEIEAKYRSQDVSQTGLFFYQFEALCRNRLRYDPGLQAMMKDPMYDEVFVGFINKLRMQIGFVDIADLLFLHSEEYRMKLQAQRESIEGRGPFLFGQREGRIAFATRKRDPLYLFSALQRHLGYPAVPRPVPVDKTNELVPQLARRLERLESRIQLMEQENRTGIDITKFYNRGPKPADWDDSTNTET